MVCVGVYVVCVGVCGVSRMDACGMWCGVRGAGVVCVYYVVCGGVWSGVCVVCGVWVWCVWYVVWYVVCCMLY